MAKVDTSKIFVYDDLFPDYLVQSFGKKLNDINRWEYGIQGRYGGQKDGRFFAIWVHRPHEQTRNPFEKDIDGIASYVHDAFCGDALKKLIPDATPTQLYRIHFNGQVPMDVDVPIHMDWEMADYWTMIYYTSGKDGDTVFYNDPLTDDGEDVGFEEVYRVKFKPGRLVFFPSYIFHAAEHPSEGLRTSLAISYCLNECSANNELRKLRGLPEVKPPDLSDSDTWKEIGSTFKVPM
tara:strand:- start:4641 stop:5348 length:708 start_codon:yes stop_codon:yes gene_type:complete